MHLRFLGIFILILISLAVFGDGNHFALEKYGLSDGRKIVRIGDAEVMAELAVTPHEKSEGLSGREALSAGEGMFFVFEGPRRYSFWMKDMSFAIDIIWIDENKEVIDITYDARPDSYPFQFQPRYPAQYALEVKSGWAQSRGVQVGDVAEFTL